MRISDFFQVSNIPQHFAVSFDINTFHFTVGWHLYKGPISFVSRCCPYFQTFTMSQRLGCLATETVKVLVFK